MKAISYIIIFFLAFSLKAQIAPFTDYDWTIEKIMTSDNTTILADPSPSGFYDELIIDYSDFLVKYVFEFSSCQGEYSFDDSNQEFEFLFWGCAITPNHTIIADHFVNVFILQEGGETITPEGAIYGPFSYDFTYSGDLVYLHITNLAGSVATFYATNLSRDEFLKDAIFVYPNPVTEVLKIESSGVALDHVNIYDINGRLIEEYQKVNSSISVGHLQKGVYILEIETSVGVLLRKKIIKK